MQLFLPHRFWETGGMAVDGAHHWLALKLQPLGLQHRSSMQATWASLAMLIWLRLRLSINCLKKRGANLVLICLWKSGVKFAPIKMCNSAMERNSLHVWWSTPIKLLLAFIRSLRMVDFDEYVHSLNQIIAWMFALDHTRWLSVQTPLQRMQLCAKMTLHSFILHSSPFHSHFSPFVSHNF